MKTWFKTIINPIVNSITTNVISHKCHCAVPLLFSQFQMRNVNYNIFIHSEP